MLKQQIVTFKNKTELEEHAKELYKTNKIALCQSTGKMYCTIDQRGTLMEVIDPSVEQTESQVMQLTAYDLVKTALGSKKYTQHDLQKALDYLNDDIFDFCLSESKHRIFMLLCNDIHYYTVFLPPYENPDTYQSQQKNDYGFLSLVDSTIECLENVGTVLSSSLSSGKVDIWVKTKEDVLYFSLFPYDEGVVYYE